MDYHEWARTLGALGTMSSAFVAVTTYVKATNKSAKAADEEKANRIRGRLHNIDNVALQLKSILENGTVFLAASASITEEIEARLPPPTNAKEISDFLSNSDMLLSVSVVGWHRSPTGAELSKILFQLQQESLQLTGYSRIIGPAIDLLVASVIDGCSPIFAHRALYALNNSNSPPVSVAAYTTLERSVDCVRVALQSVMVNYYQSRYSSAVSEICTLIAFIVNRLSSQPDKVLNDFIHSPKVESATRTSELRQWLRECVNLFDEEERNIISAHIDNIETYISKEYARENLVRQR
jgi:hypothetical protein